MPPTIEEIKKKLGPAADKKINYVLGKPAELLSPEKNFVSIQALS
jgi:hypothetical protein